MTIYTYYGDYSQHKNEKTQFENLLTQLKLEWEYSQDWIYLFYNTMWSGQEIDVIVFTRNSIIVIDLKNYSGELQGSENGEWLINSTIPVQGGSQINPFVQVRKNKFAVLEWFKSVGLFTNQNLGFISGCIIFDELSQKELEISEKVRKWFYVTDIPHVTDVLAHIKSTGINLAEDDIKYLVNKLKLREYIWDRNKSPRDIRYVFPDDHVQSNPISTSYHVPNIQLKYSLETKLLKEFSPRSFPYICFWVTILFVLIISFSIASNMYNSGQGGWNIHKLIFGS